MLIVYLGTCLIRLDPDLQLIASLLYPLSYIYLVMTEPLLLSVSVF